MYKFNRAGYLIVSMLLFLPCILFVNFAFAGEGQIDDDVLPAIDKSIQEDIPEGNYYISSCLNQKMCVDVCGGGSIDGTNVEIYSENLSSAQRWRISYDSKGYATIANYSGKVLDVYGAEAKSGSNVIQYKNLNAANQKWIIIKENNGYRIKSALSQIYNIDLCLDVYGGYSTDFTNVEVYINKNQNNQRFYFYSIDSQKITGERIVEDGDYSIRVKSKQNLCVDICGNSNQDGASVDLWSYNGGQNQIFHFTYDEATKCYKIFCVGSAKVLNVHMANPIPGAYVNQYSDKNVDEEKWALFKRADGGLLIKNRYSGLSLDVEYGLLSEGSNIDTYDSHNGSNQNFILSKESLIHDGVYSLFSYVNDEMCIDVPNGSSSSGMQLEIYNNNFGINQKYVVKVIDNNQFIFRSVCSGLLIGQDSGKVIQTNKEDDNTKWTAVWSGKGVCFLNIATGKYLDIEGRTSRIGSKLIVASKSGSLSQSFRAVFTDLVTCGTFNISPMCALNNSLNINGSSWCLGAQVFMWSGKNDNNSKWFIEKVNSTYYRIVSSMTEYVLDVANGSCHDGDKTQQWSWNGGRPQLWKIEFTDDGWFRFVNATNGLCLDCLSHSSSLGAEVGIYHRTESSSQKWRLNITTPVEFSGDKELDWHLRDICRCCPSLNGVYNFVSGYAYRDGDLWPSGNWTISYALDIIRNGSGNCYRYAALFMWCARALGCNANAICGELATTGGGRQAHGWVEVYSGGTYVCDPELQHVLGQYNFYMITYANAPVTYYK